VAHVILVPVTHWFPPEGLIVLLRNITHRGKFNGQLNRLMGVQTIVLQPLQLGRIATSMLLGCPREILPLVMEVPGTATPIPMQKPISSWPATPPVAPIAGRSKYPETMTITFLGQLPATSRTTCMWGERLLVPLPLTGLTILPLEVEILSL